MEDIASYVENGEINLENKTDIDTSVLSKREYNYYKALENEKDITIIDIINSREDIYGEYLASTESYSQNIGIDKQKFNAAYIELYKILTANTKMLGFSRISAEYLAMLGEFAGGSIVAVALEQEGKTGEEYYISMMGKRR